jgi:ribosomal 50S subunit-associated protein YjgA (DUF615 family)
MAQIIPLKSKPVAVQELEEEIDKYKCGAAAVARALHDIEVQRTRVINQIEEAVHNGLDKRTAHRLEDKLSRPYAMRLYKI